MTSKHTSLYVSDQQSINPVSILCLSMVLVARVQLQTECVLLLVQMIASMGVVDPIAILTHVWLRAVPGAPGGAIEAETHLQPVQHCPLSVESGHAAASASPPSPHLSSPPPSAHSPLPLPAAARLLLVPLAQRRQRRGHAHQRQAREHILQCPHPLRLRFLVV